MKLYNSLLLIGILFFLNACINQSVEHNRHTQDINKTKIGISKAKGSIGYERYGKWLNTIDSNIIYLDLYHMSIDSALYLLNNCDGLLVSGGPDVDPSRYNQTHDTLLCETIDYRRDSLEFALIQLALEKEMPILGICRGEQILNVYFGGSLYPDIPTAKPNNVGHRFDNIDSSMHPIYIDSSNLLVEISGTAHGIVNSSHHQAVDQLGTNLVILGCSEDSIVESIGWKEPIGKSFLLGVQWHPEWLNINNPYSGVLGERFLKEARNYQIKTH